jgi:hypothetical protein
MKRIVSVPDDYERLQTAIDAVMRATSSPAPTDRQGTVEYLAIVTARILGRMMADDIGAQKPNFGGG